MSQAPGPPNFKLDYELPKTVSSVREGWQWTCQSGAVVSGLLAAAAAQLLVFFKDDGSYNSDIASGGPGGAKGFVIASCYVALFLNISATIGSFVLIDNLGEIHFQAACKPDAFQEDITQTGRLLLFQEDLLKIFGAPSAWNFMMMHWLLTYYFGIISLTVSILTYVVMEEPLVTKIILIITVVVTLVPAVCFIFVRPISRAATKKSTPAEVSRSNTPVSVHTHASTH